MHVSVVCAYIHVCACMFICLLCVHVPVCLCMYLCLCIGMHMCSCMCTCLCTHVSMFMSLLCECAHEQRVYNISLRIAHVCANMWCLHGVYAHE